MTTTTNALTDRELLDIASGMGDAIARAWIALTEPTHPDRLVVELPPEAEEQLRRAVDLEHRLIARYHGDPVDVIDQKGDPS